MTRYGARRRLPPLFWIAAIAVALIAGGVAGALIATSARPAASSNRALSNSATQTAKRQTSTASASTLTIVSVTPAVDATDVAGNATVSATFSAADFPEHSRTHP